MPTQFMTYDELAAAWGVSREAARKKVEGLRLPRQPGNDGRTRVRVDLDEVQHQPLKPKRDRRASGDHAEAALREHVETLRTEVERLSKLASTHRADFERERERAEKAITDLVNLTDRLSEAEKTRAEKIVETEKAQAEVKQVKAEFTAWKSRPWWRRALG